MNKLKHLLSYFALIFKRIFYTLKDKRFYIILTFIIWTYLIAWFNSNYRIDTKFTFGIYKRANPTPVMPLVATISAQVVITTPAPKTEKEIVYAEKHGSILWKIYFLESTLGEHDYCRNNGKGYGGFGVKSDSKTIACYKTFQEAADRAEYWFAKLEPDKDLAKSLCMWNLGVPEVNCNYYQTYMSL